MKPTRGSQGFSLIETTIAMLVLGIGILGVMNLQIIGARMTHMSNHLMQATTLAHDLAENVSMWGYLDTRLAVPSGRTAVSALSAVTGILGLGHTQTLTGSQMADYSENVNTIGTTTPDASVSIAGVLGTATGAAAYDGFSADVDNDGQLDFARYWNVYPLDADADGVEDGKLIVVTIRWHEPGFAASQWRTIQESVFKTNPLVYTR